MVSWRGRGVGVGRVVGVGVDGVGVGVEVGVDVGVDVVANIMGEWGRWNGVGDGWLVVYMCNGWSGRLYTIANGRDESNDRMDA